jgi:hypothetical protein
LYLWAFIAPINDEIWARVPSLIFYTAAILSAWAFFPDKENKTQRIIFTLLPAISYYALYYATDARSYALLLFLSVNLFLLTLNLAQKIRGNRQIKPQFFVLYFLLSLCSAFTHYLGAVLTGVYGFILCAYALKYKKYFLRVFAVCGAVFILLALWATPQAMQNLANLNGGYWTKDTPLLEAVYEVNKLLFTSNAAVFIIDFICLCSLYQIWRREKHLLQSPSFVVPAAACAVIYALCAVLYFKINFFMSRYFIAVMPCAFYLFAYFIAYAGARKKLFLFLASVAFCLITWTSFLNFRAGKINSEARDAAQFIIAKEPAAKERFYYLKPFYPPEAQEGVASFYFKKLGDGAKFFNAALPEGKTAFKKNFDKTSLIWIITCDFDEVKNLGAQGAHIIGQTCISFK